MRTDFSVPATTLAPGSVHAGFEVERAERLAEISGCAYVLRHRETGARALWLACADDNKAFAIAFKTPPADDTGVFHILEHSVLCGSDRFPVKEPFVHLLKSSMQTFLNALTFSDKTMYPVASTNDRDLENLMDVYLDAVLHPAIYRRRRIFEQEGWHYELADAEGELSYNGVVYNEMRGAMSSPDEVLVCGVARSLFPNGPYGWVSGGDPCHIPDLSYEEFLDTHARHYQLSNSYTVLYGNLDIERKLAFLDERFRTAEQRGAGAPNPLPPHAPIDAAPLTITMRTTPDNACVGAAYVFATASQRERVLAGDVLMDALMGSNEAPLKKALLEAGIARDASGFLFDGLLQPILVFTLKGSKPGVAGRFREVLEDTCARLVREGIGHANLEASLAQAEFNLREGDWGYPDGVGLAIQAMSGWLYDDDAALDYLRYEDALASMRAGLDSGYFERLLDEAVCQCAHRCLVDVAPREDDEPSPESMRLARVRESLGAGEVDAIVAETKALHAEQARPDTAEALATLPRLDLTDIGGAPADPASHRVDAPVACWRHDIETHHIDYVYHYFDLGCLSFEELPYATVLCSLLGKLDTESHTAQELDTLVESKLGNLSFFTETYADDGDPTDARPRLVVGASALAENSSWLATLPAEIWSSTRLDDRRRVRDILEQRRVGMEAAFVDSGHAAALSRVGSYFLASGVVSEQLGGVDFYRFLRDLLERFDERYDELVAILRGVASRVFVAKGCETSFTGSAEELSSFWEAAGGLSLATSDPAGRALAVPKPAVRSEAFVVPANVCFVGEGMAGAPHGVRPGGTWRVAAQALSYDYLWNEVRVLGGAYGCGFRCTTDSTLQFYSYRDPAIDPTVRRFEAAGSWLAEWDPSQDELDGYVIATTGGMDAPVKPRALGRRLDAMRLSHRDADWRERTRAEVLSTTAPAVRALAAPLDALHGDHGICVFGGREIIGASELDLEVTELFEAPRA